MRLRVERMKVDEVAIREFLHTAYPRLVVVDTGDFTEPAKDAVGPSFGSGETLCGSSLGP